MNIKDYGFQPSMIPEHTPGIPARITAVHRDLFEFVSDAGSGIARLKAGEYYTGSEPIPTTGDFVMLDYQPGESRIRKTLPRRSYFSRRDPSSSGHKEQAIAANFDYVFILQSLERGMSAQGLARYLTLAWQSGAIPAVILTKADCAEDTAAQVHTVERTAVGVEVFAVSAKTGSGLDRLSAYTQPGKTAVFLGPSGVGKSTMVNALAQKEIMATGATREKDGRGRHTTSHRQLVLLDSGLMVIDTPGMRELGMWDVSQGLTKSFADVTQYFDQCRFRDCSHTSEPGCAVRAAIRRGDLLLEHWESYLELRAEAQYADDKAGYLRKKQEWQRSIALYQKQWQKSDYRHTPCAEPFFCKACGKPVSPESTGSKHRNHCPHCLCSLHVDSKSGDRASACRGIMDPIGVWVKQNGEWAIIHRCQACGTLRANRIAADDNPALLLALAQKPVDNIPFPV